MRVTATWWVAGAVIIAAACDGRGSDPEPEKTALPGQEYQLVERFFSDTGCADAVYYYQAISTIDFHQRPTWDHASIRFAVDDGRTVWSPTGWSTKPTVFMYPAEGDEPRTLPLMSGEHFGKADYQYRLTVILRGDELVVEDVFEVTDCRRPEFCMPYQYEGCTVRSRSVFEYAGELQDYNRDAESFRDLNPWPEGS